MKSLDLVRVELLLWIWTAESDVLMLQGLCRWQVFIALTWAAMRRRRTLAVYTPLTLLPRARERWGEKHWAGGRTQGDGVG